MPIVSSYDSHYQMLDWLLAGQAARQAAVQAGISVRTIEQHWARIKEKLHCRNKPELLLKLFGK